MLCFYALTTHSAQLVTLSTNGEVATKSWKAMRDADVVKQNFDYSCGAASLATLLNEFYGLSLTEVQILTYMNKQDLMANFDDMARVVSRYGFKAGGVALSYEQLAKLTVPVVVYLRHRNQDHFSVLRGISETHVQLADPSWGNRIYSKAQFLAMWETREDEKLKGKILLVLQTSREPITKNQAFFAPPTPNNLGIEALVTQRSY
ncbi:MAG: C39 family peptidase [Methylotenera sp.]|uniref:C39 family peptidase n=1 Tax=Methylotenera sp. TaxID=2051956 RepID=UPI00271F318B|nr:C39 family peptidase [Methylotenera sp.]MDO9394033.1 C39 family peptidase [Methylotenera sp.]